MSLAPGTQSFQFTNILHISMGIRQTNKTTIAVTLTPFGTSKNDTIDAASVMAIAPNARAIIVVSSLPPPR